MNFKHVIIGGDERFYTFIKKLLADGTDVELLAPDLGILKENGIMLKQSEIKDNLEQLSIKDGLVFLPIPMSRDGLTFTSSYTGGIYVRDALRAINRGRPHAVIGYLNPEAEVYFTNNNIPFINLEHREDFSIYNALLTVEGAVNMTGNLLKSSMFKKKAVITGYGRISKILARILTCYGTEVTLAIRKLDGRVWAEVLGYKSVDFTRLNEALRGADIIYNTVPWPIFKEENVEAFKPGALYMELASKPGGIEDRSVFADRYTYYEYLSIPAKYCPESAGEVLYKTYQNIMEEYRNGA